MMRQCGECNACCRLLPVVELGKLAGQACRHQRFKKGCAVYHKAGMPPSCQIWNCRWIVNDDTADQSRPDRAGYVIDLMPDYVTVVNNDSGEQQHVEVVQIWVANYNRSLHHDSKDLRAYIERRGAENKLCLLRYDNKDALTVIPPSMAHDGQWHEVKGESHGQHTAGQVLGLEAR